MNFFVSITHITVLSLTSLTPLIISNARKQTNKRHSHRKKKITYKFEFLTPSTF